MFILFNFTGYFFSRVCFGVPLFLEFLLNHHFFVFLFVTFMPALPPGAPSSMSLTFTLHIRPNRWKLLSIFLLVLIFLDNGIFLLRLVFYNTAILNDPL